MTTAGIILIVAYALGFTIGFLHGSSAKHNKYNEL
jgi:hypothetical protein